MALSESLNKPAAKTLIVVVAVAAIGFVAFQFKNSPAFSSNDYGKQVPVQTQIDDAQRAVTALQANTSLPNDVKAAQIQHLQSIIDQAKGQTHKSGPPNSGGG